MNTFANTFELIPNAVILVIAVFSAYTDARYRKILNMVTYPGVLFGFLYHTLVSLLTHHGLLGFLFALYGFLLGFGFFFLFYWISKGKKMGAGDVKLFSAIGACMGLHATLVVLVITAVVGLLVSVLLLFPIFYRAIRTGNISILKAYSYYPIPYGTVIGISVFLWFLVRCLGLTGSFYLPFYN